MLFALPVPYSRFCREGLMMVKWPRHVKINTKYCCVWLELETILFSFSNKILYCTCHNKGVYINFKRCTDHSNTEFRLWGTVKLTARIYFQISVGNIFLVRRLVVVDKKTDDLSTTRFVFKGIRRKRKFPDQSQEHLMNWKNTFETLLPFLLVIS
jgi:hypothetical protein